MKIDQDLYSEFEHTPSTTWNMDETAVTWSIGPTHLYCPRDQQRASQIGISNTKLRITAVITVNAAGAFAPLMIIIKHSVSSAIKPDQTGMKVIRELHTNASKGFTAQDGWELLKWEKEITIKGVIKKLVPHTHRYRTCHHQSIQSMERSSQNSYVGSSHHWTH